jgi:predicted nucleic acid-binding protein
VISLVIDASVAVKWFLPEAHALDASSVLDRRFTRVAPDFLWLEFGNALAARCRENQLTGTDASRILEALARYPVAYVASRPLVADGLKIAVRLGRGLYDCVYLALAMNRNARMVTADRKFYDAIKQSSHASSILWIEDAARLARSP